MGQTRLIGLLAADDPHPIFPPKGADRANKLDVQAVLPRDLFGVMADGLPPRLGEAGIVNEPRISARTVSSKFIGPYHLTNMMMTLFCPAE